MAHPPTRWGILSAGLIAEDFGRVVSALPAEDHKVVAIAARKKEDAQKFADKFGIPKAYEGYEHLEKDPDIDVVYIGTLHIYHAEQSKRMMRAGKHVLCEKPSTINSRELEEVLAVAKETGKFFMEGFWSRCFPVYDRLREVLKSETLGDIKVVSAEMGFSKFDTPRIRQRSMGGGALMDVGCYCVQFADFVLGPGMPEKISATAVITDEVDEAVIITLVYPGKKIAVVTGSVNVDCINRAIVRGSKGKAEVSLIWCPEEITLPSGKEEYKLPPGHKGLNFPNTQGFRYEAYTVRDCLIKGLLEPPQIPHNSSRTIMAILDEVRRQIGVVYDADK